MTWYSLLGTLAERQGQDRQEEVVFPTVFNPLEKRRSCRQCRPCRKAGCISPDFQGKWDGRRKTDAIQGVVQMKPFLAELRGVETITGSSKGAWPGDEFIHPYPIFAMVVLGVNDHLLKGSGWVPSVLTGKLSDFAGLFFFPLFLTALWNTALYLLFRLRPRMVFNYSYTSTKLLVSVLFTAALFVPLQLSTSFGRAYLWLLQRIDLFGLFSGFAVTADPTDLLALSVFFLLYLHGRSTLGRFPVGRLAWIRRRLGTVRPEQAEQVFAASVKDISRLCRTEGKQQALQRLNRAFCAYVLEGGEKRMEEAELALTAFRQAR